MSTCMVRDVSGRPGLHGAGSTHAVAASWHESWQYCAAHRRQGCSCNYSSMPGSTEDQRGNTRHARFSMHALSMHESKCVRCRWHSTCKCRNSAAPHVGQHWAADGQQCKSSGQKGNQTRAPSRACLHRVYTCAMSRKRDPDYIPERSAPVRHNKAR